MSFTTPFETQLLAEVRQTNLLLQQLVVLFAPAKYVTAMAQGDSTEARKMQAQALAEQQPGLLDSSAVAAALGLTPLRPPGTPPTPGQRAERWAARAAEVGMPPEEAEVAAQRAGRGLADLVQRDGEEAPKRAPAKRAPKKQQS